MASNSLVSGQWWTQRAGGAHLVLLLDSVVVALGMLACVRSPVEGGQCAGELAGGWYLLGHVPSLVVGIG